MQSRDSLAQYGPNALEQERECFGDGRQVLQGPMPDFVTHGPSLGIEERRFLAWFVWLLRLLSPFKEVVLQAELQPAAESAVCVLCCQVAVKIFGADVEVPGRIPDKIEGGVIAFAEKSFRLPEFPLQVSVAVGGSRSPLFMPIMLIGDEGSQGRSRAKLQR